MYGIIAFAAIIVTAFAVLGCASTPSVPTEIVFNESIPENQSAYLCFPSNKGSGLGGGTFYILRCKTVGFDKWFNPQLNSFRNSLNIRIPQGENAISFVYWFKAFAGTNYSPWFPHEGRFAATFKPDTSSPDPYHGRYISMSFDAKAGRNYSLFPSVTFSEARFAFYEISQTREPNSNEQVLFINYDISALGYVLILNKGTNDERSFYLSLTSKNIRSTNEIRIIVPKGTHTIDLGINIFNASYREDRRPKIEPDGNQPQRFSASSEPVRYSISVTPERGTNRVLNGRYTLTQQ